MADTPITTPVSASDGAEAASNVMREFDTTMKQLLKKVIGERGAEGAEKFLGSLVKSLKSQVDNLSGSIDLSNILNIDLPKFQKYIQHGIKNTVDGIQVSAFKLGVDFDADKVTNSLAGIGQQLTNTSTLANVGLYGALTKLSDIAINNPVTQKLNEWEQHLLRIDRMGLENFGSRINPSNIEDATASLEGLNNVFRDQMQGLVALGIDIDDSNQRLAKLGKSANITLQQIQMLGAGSADLGEKLKGAAGFEQILAASGMDAAVGAQVLEYQMRSLGVQAKDALAVFDTFRQVQKGTILTSDEIAQSIITAGQEFKFLGNNLSGVSAIYSEFLQGFGKGQEKLAKASFEGMIKGLSQMSTEMKAFIGLNTQLGAGAGALGASLRIEEAMTSGEGLKEVMDSVYDTIEERSGTPILTRKEAIAQGREQEFTVQRELFKQATGITDDAQINKMFEARAKGIQVRPEDLTPTREFGEVTAGGADKVLNQKYGGAQRLKNILGGTAELEGTNELSQTLLGIGQGLKPAGEEMVNVIKQMSANWSLAAKMNLSRETIEEGGARDKIIQTRADAKKRVLKDQIAAANENKTALGEGEELMQYMGAAQTANANLQQLKQQVAEPTVAKKTQAQLQASIDIPTIVEKTNVTPLEPHMMPKEVSSTTGTADLSYYTNMIASQDKGNSYLSEIVANTANAISVTSADKNRALSTKPIYEVPPLERSKTLPVVESKPEDKNTKPGTKAAGAAPIASGTEVPINFVVTVKNGTLMIDTESKVVQMPSKAHME